VRNALWANTNQILGALNALLAKRVRSQIRLELQFALCVQVVPLATRKRQHHVHLAPPDTFRSKVPRHAWDAQQDATAISQQEILVHCVLRANLPATVGVQVAQTAALGISGQVLVRLIARHALQVPSHMWLVQLLVPVAAWESISPPWALRNASVVHLGISNRNLGPLNVRLVLLAALLRWKVRLLVLCAHLGRLHPSLVQLLASYALQVSTTPQVELWHAQVAARERSQLWMARRPVLSAQLEDSNRTKALQNVLHVLLDITILRSAP
jgi:hypothetical protein